MALCDTWAFEADMCMPCSDYTASEDYGPYLEMASEILYMLSGQQFPGTCTVKIRPCTQSRFVPYRDFWFPGTRAMYSLDTWGWPFLACSCTTPDECGCGNLSQIELAPGPVVQVTKVMIDGVLLPTTAYRLDPPNLLVRLDGDRWPCCQDLSLADTEPDTWSVEFAYGRMPPLAGIKAAAVLACELFRACNPDAIAGDCRLPTNVISIARQGVTVLLNQTELFLTQPNQPARTGLVEVDLFLRSYNPFGNTSPSIVLSPDLPPVGRITGS